MKERLARVLSRMESFHLTRLDPGPFEFGEDWSLEDDDVSRTLVQHRPPPLLFSRFSAERVLQDLERCHILARIRELGYTDIRGEFRGQDAFETRFCLLASHEDVEDPCILMDIRTHQGQFRAEGPFEGEEFDLRALILDWISLQNAARPLPTDRLAFPGQKHPGLGVFRRAYRMTLGYLRSTDFDVVVNIPEYFHNAVLYSRDFKFFMPHRQGHFLAMKRDLVPRGLARSSHALAIDEDVPFDERVEQQETGNIVAWTPAEQVLWLSPRMRDYFYDSRYVRAVQHEKDTHHYRLIKSRSAKDDPRDDVHSAPVRKPL